MKPINRLQNVIIGSRGNFHARQHEHFAACQRTSKPFVTVATKRRFSSIELDMFTTSCCLDDTVQSEMIALLQAHSEPDASITWSALICRSTKVRSDRAEEVAAALYDLAERAMGLALITPTRAANARA
jgi:hypothetical protein